MLFDEFLCLAMTNTEEDYVGFAMPFGIKTQLGVAGQVLMDDRHRLAGIALAMDEFYIYGRMVDQQPDHLPAGVPGAADNACSYSFHNIRLKSRGGRNSVVYCRRL